jgi:dTDP-glucose 4,6-dehydratase
MDFGRRTVLVTGGAGFIGTNLCATLLDDPLARVVCLDKLGYAAHAAHARALAATEPRFDLVICDLVDAVATREVVHAVVPDAVVHLAAESHVDRSLDSPAPFVAANVLGTFHLLETCRAYWNGLDGPRRDSFRFLHVSTDEVYGAASVGDFFIETTPYNPSSPYAATKAGADHLAMAYARSFGLPVIITRSTNNFGPWQFPEKLIPLATARALAGAKVPIYGDGKQERDWLFVQDHVAGLLAALARGQPGRSYNFGAGRPVANIDLVRQLLQQLTMLAPPAGEPYEALLRFVTDRPAHDQRYAIDPRRAVQELAWQPSVSLEEGLHRTVAWYLANRRWLDALGMAPMRRQGLASRGSAAKEPPA